jgi:hypothetical protein
MGQWRGIDIIKIKHRNLNKNRKERQGKNECEKKRGVERKNRKISQSEK